MDLSSHGGGEMPIPMPLNSKYVGHHHSIQPSSNGPSPTQPPTSEPHQSLSYNLSTMNIKKGGGGGVAVKYRECLKNHAAAIGGNATDGCGEFMPSGEEGTMEALKCSACNCHRNFHRKEVEGETYDPPPFHHHHQFMKHSRNKVVGQKGVLVSSHCDTTFGGYNPILPLPSPHHMIMPIGAMQTSESDEIDGIAGSGGGGIMSMPPTTRKRFRTKFTPDQKEKMLSFADKFGWRLQRQEEGEVQRFCQEIGVKRRVLKVWMHNNKHNLARRSTISITAAANTTNNSTMSNSNPIQMQVQGPHISMQTDM